MGDQGVQETVIERARIVRRVQVLKHVLFAVLASQRVQHGDDKLQLNHLTQHADDLIHHRLRHVAHGTVPPLVRTRQGEQERMT